MNEFDLTSLYDVLDRARSLESDYRQRRNYEIGAEKSDAALTLSVLSEALAYCQQEGFDDATEVIQRMVYGTEYEIRDLSTMISEIGHMRNALYDELRKRVFLAVAHEREKFVNHPHLFGEAVHNAFPSARIDIREAGNCLAADCNTAAVFHLMRSVEWGLRALCENVGLRRAARRIKSGKKKYVAISYVDWESMLNQLQDKVDAKITKLSRGKTKQSAQEFYYPVLQDIRGIRDAWRNHVMHTRSDYTAKDADAIFFHVQRLMGVLATRVGEK